MRITKFKTIHKVLDWFLLGGLCVGLLENLIIMVADPTWVHAGDVGIIAFATTSFWINIQDQKAIDALTAEVEELKITSKMN